MNANPSSQIHAILILNQMGQTTANQMSIQTTVEIVLHVMMYLGSPTIEVINISIQGQNDVKAHNIKTNYAMFGPKVRVHSNYGPVNKCNLLIRMTSPGPKGYLLRGLHCICKCVLWLLS